MADLSVFGRLKSKQDYDREEQAFQLARQEKLSALKSAQVERDLATQKAQYLDIDKLGEQAVYEAALGMPLTPEKAAAARIYNAKGQGMGFDPATQAFYQKQGVADRLGLSLGGGMPAQQNTSIQPVTTDLLDAQLPPDMGGRTAPPRAPITFSSDNPANAGVGNKKPDKYDEAVQEALRLTEGNPRARQEVLTEIVKQKIAKPKLTSTDMAEMYAAGDIIGQSRSALSALQKANNILNRQGGDKPFSGFGAGSLSSANDIPLVGAFIDDKRSAATAEYDTLIKENALSSMKAIFGGNPTEGERQILLDLQAISSYKPDKQQAIINNAIEAANRRIKFNQEKIRGIKTGDFDYALGEEPPPPNAPKLGKADIEATIFNARKALKEGADLEDVRARLIENGIDPSKAGI